MNLIESTFSLLFIPLKKNRKLNKKKKLCIMSLNLKIINLYINLYAKKAS